MISATCKVANKSTGVTRVLYYIGPFSIDCFKTKNLAHADILKMRDELIKEK